MALEQYIKKDGKELRLGYTTGTCAALAAASATAILLGGKAPESASLMTEKGIEVKVDLEQFGKEGDFAWAGFPKDAGDDADVTDGLLICARVRKAGAEGIRIDGGEGVGRVTKEGLDQSVGNAAINSGPRRQIRKEVEKICRRFGYDGGMDVEIYVPEGTAAAKKTFNENLGIKGGISILGTTGIVEPMSQQALIDTIALEMKQAGIGCDRLILTPGNYGSHYIEEEGLDKLEDGKGAFVPVLRFSNFLGDTLDMLEDCGIREVLLVAHAGKLVKVAGGIMNTHSRWADCRAEILCAHTAIMGGDRMLCDKIMSAATTDACFDLLEEAGLLSRVIESVMAAVQKQLKHRVSDRITIGAIMFSRIHGSLGKTKEAEELLRRWQRS